MTADLDSEKLTSPFELRILCERSFAFVSIPSRLGIDPLQNRTALTLVFEKLQDEVPVPKADAWYSQVFSNYDRKGSGLLDFEAFFDVVQQYHSFHVSKRRSRKTPKKKPVDGMPLPSAAGKLIRVSCAASPSPTVCSTVCSGETVMFPRKTGRLAIFEHYEFLDRTGQGSFGKVLIVRHRQTKQIRACKAVGSSSPSELVQSEISFLKTLDHPNILRLFETYEDGSNIYLVTELCEGGSLADRIRYQYETVRVGISENLAATYMQQILSALAYCHSQGLIHRDVKPEASDSALKLIDFGLACKKDLLVESVNSGISGVLARWLPVSRKFLTPQPQAGSPGYMSPEMLQGFYDEKSDLFSVGVLLYQLLTGFSPWQSDGPISKDIVLKSRPSYPSAIWGCISAAARNLTENLLRKNLKKRFSANEALKHIWLTDRKQIHGHASQLTVSVFDGLKGFAEHGNFKRLVLQLLARGLTEFQVQDLRKKFLALDSAGDGLLTLDELNRGVKELGIHLGNVELQDIVNSVSSGSRSISYNDFIAALCERKIKFESVHLREVFDRLDVFNEGRITVQGLQQVFSNQALLSDDEADGIFGKDRKGISFEEFCKLVSSSSYTQSYMD